MLSRSPPNKKPEDYLERATSCERLADGATSQETREIMLHLAMRWRALAETDGVTNRDPPKHRSR